MLIESTNGGGDGAHDASCVSKDVSDHVIDCRRRSPALTKARSRRYKNSSVVAGSNRSQRDEERYEEVGAIGIIDSNCDRSTADVEGTSTPHGQDRPEAPPSSSSVPALGLPASGCFQEVVDPTHTTRHVHDGGAVS